jgi:hypothetical protein
MTDLFAPTLVLDDIEGQDVGLLTRTLDADVPRVVIIGPLGSCKTTVLKRWARHFGAMLLPRTDKPSFRKAVQKTNGCMALDRLDRVDDGWHDLLVEAILSKGSKILATFDGSVELYKDKVDRSLRALLTPIVFKPLDSKAVAGILSKRGSFDSALIDLVSVCGNVGFALNVLEVTQDEATVMEMLEAGPGHNDPDAPTVHRGLISDALSALIKECRRGDVQKTAYWATVLLHCYKAPVRQIVRRLVISAGEEHHCIEAYQLAQAVATTYAMIGDGWDQKEYVLRAWCLMAALPKFWDTELGRLHEDRYGYELEVEREGVRPIPSYALDKHTWSGRRMAQKGQWLDRRASGPPWSRLNMMLLSRGFWGQSGGSVGSLGKGLVSEERPDTEQEANPWKFMPLEELLDMFGSGPLALRMSARYEWDREYLAGLDALDEEDDGYTGI